MDVSNTSVSGELPTDWASAGSLISVNITGTTVAGPLPAAWFNLSTPSRRITLGLPTASTDSPVCLPAPAPPISVILDPAAPPPCDRFSSWTVQLSPAVACRLAAVCPAAGERMQPLTDRAQKLATENTTLPRVHALECRALCPNASQPEYAAATITAQQPASVQIDHSKRIPVSGDAMVITASNDTERTAGPAGMRRSLRGLNPGRKGWEAVWGAQLVHLLRYDAAVGGGRRRLRDEPDGGSRDMGEQDPGGGKQDDGGGMGGQHPSSRGADGGVEATPEGSLGPKRLPLEDLSGNEGPGQGKAPSPAPLEPTGPTGLPSAQSPGPAQASTPPPPSPAPPASPPGNATPAAVTFATTGAEPTAELGRAVLLALFSDVLTAADLQAAQLDFTQRTQAMPSPSSPADSDSAQTPGLVALPATGDSLPASRSGRGALSKRAIIVITTLGSIAAALALALLSWYCCGGRSRPFRSKPSHTDSSGTSLPTTLHRDDSLCNTTADMSKCLHRTASDSEHRGNSPTSTHRKLGFLQQPQRSCLVHSQSRGSVADLASASTTPHRSYRDPDTGPGSSVALGVSGISELEGAAAGSRVFFDVGGSTCTNTVGNTQGEGPSNEVSTGHWRLDSGLGSPPLGGVHRVIYEEQEEGQETGASGGAVGAESAAAAEAAAESAAAAEAAAESEACKGDLQRTQTVAVVELSEVPHMGGAESQPVAAAAGAGGSGLMPSVLMRSDVSWRGSHAFDSLPVDVPGVWPPSSFRRISCCLSC
jgi:hypothetical protein